MPSVIMYDVSATAVWLIVSVVFVRYVSYFNIQLAWSGGMIYTLYTNEYRLPSHLPEIESEWSCLAIELGEREVESMRFRMISLSWSCGSFVLCFCSFVGLEIRAVTSIFHFISTFIIRVPFPSCLLVFVDWRTNFFVYSVSCWFHVPSWLYRYLWGREMRITTRWW